MSKCPLHSLPLIRKLIAEESKDGTIKRVSPKSNSLSHISNTPIVDIFSSFKYNGVSASAELKSRIQFSLKYEDSDSVLHMCSELCLSGFGYSIFQHCLHQYNPTVITKGHTIQLPKRRIFNEAQMLYLAIQAFDSVFTQNDLDGFDVNDRDELLKSLLILASIPSEVQKLITGYTSPSQRIMDLIKSCYYSMKSRRRVSVTEFRIRKGIHETKESYSGKYSTCPAVIDGTLRRTFEALFPLYQQAQKSQ